MTVPPKHLDQVAALAAKDEDMTTEGIDVERCLRDRSQAIEAAAHVGNTSNQPDPCPGRQADHLGDPKPNSNNSRNRTPSTAWSGVPRMTTVMSLRRISISPSFGVLTGRT